MNIGYNYIFKFFVTFTFLQVLRIDKKAKRLNVLYDYPNYLLWINNATINIIIAVNKRNLVDGDVLSIYSIVSISADT